MYRSVKHIQRVKPVRIKKRDTFFAAIFGDLDKVNCFFLITIRQ